MYLLEIFVKILKIQKNTNSKKLDILKFKISYVGS